MVEGRLSSVLQIRDVTSFCFLSSVVFSCPRLTHSHHPVLLFPLFIFSFYLRWPHFSSVFFAYLLLYSAVLQAFVWNDPICLLSSFLSLIFPPPALLSPSALLPLSVHHSSPLSSNSITFSLLSFSSSDFTFSSYSSFYHPPISKHLPAFTLGIWHPFTLSSDSIFILFKCVYHILTSCLRSRPPPLFYYLLNWSHLSFSSTEI